MNLLQLREGTVNRYIATVMKRPFCLIASVLAILAGCLAEKYPLLVPFNKEYDLVRKALPGMQVLERDISEYSAEGGEAVLYREPDGSPRLVKTETSAAMGKALEEYYFKDNKLFLVFTEVRVYNAPKYLTREKADKAGAEAYDPEQTQVRKNWYYFSDSAMVFWLGPDQKPVSPASNRFKEAQEEKKGLAKQLLSFF